jgi:TatD DNase family protein
MSDTLPPLVDTHAHLMDAAFREDLAEVLERAQAAGVRRIVCVGYDLGTSYASVELARRFPVLRATVGIHPNAVAATPEAAFDEVASLAREAEVVGIGETGLDYYRHRTPAARQNEALRWHLSLAEELHLPVIVHNRQAEGDVGEPLADSAARRPAGETPGVLHCFSSGDLTYLQRMLAAGYFVSFAGPLTFKNAGLLPDMAARVPPARLLVETDCPYLAPAPLRGRRNEPAFVRYTAQRLAEVHQLAFPALADRLWTNSCQVFPALARLVTGVAS